MKTLLTCCLVFFSLHAVAQSTVYQTFEVDSVAEPRGGQAYLNNFLQANLHKPIQIEAKGIGGRVLLTGVVETDGKLSNPKILQGFQPACNLEALRVFRAYNVWKPAQKNGQAVRQQITVPVTFAKNDPFLYVNGARVTYFDSEKKAVIDSTQALYKQLLPLDSVGVPTGDRVAYRLRGTSWKEYSRLPLIRKANAYKTDDGRSVQLIGYLNASLRWEGPLVEVDEAGDIVKRTYYENGKQVGTALTYYVNGLVEEKSDEFEDRFVYTSWYPNGQIKQICTRYNSVPMQSANPEEVAGLWDREGHQQIKSGTGQATYQTNAKSYINPAQKTVFTEQGNYKNGLKQGIWTGTYADKSYFYEEKYDKGICQGGKARTGNADTVQYSIIEKMPEFEGGMQGLGRFLAENLRYPSLAQRAGAQGKVFVSFVVCEDGTLCDYEVVKSVQPDIDEEAVRVVKKMSGRWTPGTQRGKKVRVKYSMPINFTLE